MKRLLFLILLISASVYCGFIWGQETTEPVVIVHTETQVITEYVETIDEVRVPHFKTVYLTKTVEIQPPELKHFETISELERWLESKPIMITSGGDCDDFAIRLQEEAYEDGYYVSIYAEKYHFRNLAFAGNVCYLIEPQDHEIEWFIRID